MHFHQNNLNDRTSSNKAIKIEKASSILIEIREDECDNLLTELITHLHHGITKFAKFHTTRAIRVKELENTLHINLYSIQYHPLIHFLENSTKLVKIDAATAISVMLKNQLIAHIHGDKQARLLESVMHLSTIDSRSSSSSISPRFTVLQRQTEMLHRDPSEFHEAEESEREKVVEPLECEKMSGKLTTDILITHWTLHVKSPCTGYIESLGLLTHT